MNRLQFSIDIMTGKPQIWKALWDEQSYREWVSVFSEGSYAVTDDWKEGSKVLFLSADQSGIYSSIEKHIPNETMTFRHIGTVLKGKEQPMADDPKTWSEATETYTLSAGDGYNTLRVEIDVLDEHLDFMRTTFPKALETIKRLSKK